MKDKVSILISSCDKFKDVWPIFSFYFDKNWSDCELDKYFLSNNVNSDIEGFDSITVGNDISWSSNLSIALKQIYTDYVLIMLDDVFIDQKVDNNNFNIIVNDFIECNGNYLKFLAQPKSRLKSSSQYFYVLPPKTLYRSTAVFALWKKSTLLDLLEENENPWEFEDKASIRSDKYDEFFVVKKNFFKYIHGVVRGKFVKSSYNKIISEHPEISSLLIRQVNPWTYEIKLYFVRLRHKLFYFFIPKTYRRSVKLLFKKHF